MLPYQPLPYRRLPPPPSYNPNLTRRLQFNGGGTSITGVGCFDVLILLAVIITVVAACGYLASHI